MKRSLVVFTKKNYTSLITKSFRIKKIIKRKGNQSYVKWKEYGNYFNTWINKKDLIKISNKISQYFPLYRSSGGNIK